MMRYGRQFHPAIAEVHPELHALLRDTADEALPDQAVLPRAMLRLRALFRTAEPVLAVPTSSAVLREIALRAGVDQRALVVVAGPDGEALAAGLEALGKEVIRLLVPPGRALEPPHLARFLCGPSVDTVVLAHADLGTGVLAPLAELARVVRTRRELFLFVDATGSLGAAPLETDRWGLDLVLAGSEGPLGLPAGLGFAVASPRFLARLRRQSARGLQLDLAAHAAAASRGQVLGTIPPTLARALDRQLQRILEEETLEARWARHAALGAAVDAWLADRDDVRLLAAAGWRAPVVSCLELPPDRAAADVVAVLQREGWRLAPATVEHPRLLRLGHMGDHQPDHLAALLAALAGALATRPGSAPPATAGPGLPAPG